MHPRLKRDQKTLDLMIDMYCHDKHAQTDETCAECTTLKKYAQLRREKCPYQEQKTICAKCPTHCYKKSMRDKIREVMIYAGPHMLIRHPVLTILHMLDSLRKPVALNRKKTA